MYHGLKLLLISTHRKQLSPSVLFSVTKLVHTVDSAMKHFLPCLIMRYWNSTRKCNATLNTMQNEIGAQGTKEALFSHRRNTKEKFRG